MSSFSPVILAALAALRWQKCTSTCVSGLWEVISQIREVSTSHKDTILMTCLLSIVSRFTHQTSPSFMVQSTNEAPHHLQPKEEIIHSSLSLPRCHLTVANNTWISPTSLSPIAIVLDRPRRTSCNGRTVTVRASMATPLLWNISSTEFVHKWVVALNWATAWRVDVVPDEAALTVMMLKLYADHCNQMSSCQH